MVVEFAGLLADADSVVFVVYVSFLFEMLLKCQVMMRLVQISLLDLLSMDLVVGQTVLNLPEHLLPLCPFIGLHQRVLPVHSLVVLDHVVVVLSLDLHFLRFLSLL